ncbi:signal peptide peptidase SppA [Fulvivirgaceae bacterium PWU4]|uniref:Signal peptide peptidase SppA n=1 Tax=Chryseosolibacter histidini TaxID=2782349 RepID=A0AAP2GQV2_9BACT|nr:signal peptide peptidase SppA [Chryseosolibacter histidini]MBT1699355.1 signal peptide peptidase SppA [Chryseosolibacter histidini]
MTFARAFFSSCLGALAAMAVFFVLAFIFLISLVAGLSSEKEVIIEDNSVLHLKLDARINELQEDDPLAGLPVVGGEVPKVGLLQLKQAIAHARDNDKIKGIYLEARYPMAGFSSLEEIRESLIDFRKSGKWVVSYNEVMSEGAYYLATAADKVYLNPEGEVEFNGLTAEIGFFKKMLDKLEIRPQVFRVGEFKSAVEPFLLEKMSDENRLQLTELVNSMYDHVLTRISEARDIPKEKLKEISDKMMVRTAAVAKELKLVDDLLYKDEFDKELRNRLGLSESDDIKFVKYNKYRKSFSSSKSSNNEIAVIVAEGTIMPGTNDQSEQVIGADTFVEEIRKARQDDDVKAIVLRVNSPGGEFRSSDMIWREVQLAKAAKPVIASMSDYAASGGYYLSMGCDTIVAQPHTITGSIGIFGIMFDLSNFLDNKIGITFDEVRTGNYGEMFTVTRPLTDAEKSFWQRNLEEHYGTFTRKAAEGRHVSEDDIRKVASGRVWTGTQAREHHLVDVLGGFNDAVKIAAEKAGVADDYKLRYYPKPKSFFEELLFQLEENTESSAVREELGEFKVWYDEVKKIQTYQGAQARMPFELQIH